MITARPALAQVFGIFSGGGLKARSLRATGIVVMMFGAQRMLQLASNLLLTRILFPEAFGLMALVAVFINGIGLISDIGIEPSLVRSQRSDEPVFQSTAWTLQVVRGLWITGLAWLLAWPFARIYDEPLLFPLICVASLSAAISGFKSVQAAIRQRELRFGSVAVIGLLNQAATVGLTVLTAWLLQSVWALALGTVFGAMVHVVLSHIVLPSPNHRFSWDRSVLSEIMNFGRWILLSTTFTYLGGNGIKAVQGYLVGLETLALIHIAGMIALMVNGLAGTILSKVGFSALSEVVRQRPADVGRMVWKVRGLQTLATTPALVLLAFAAQPVIDLLYDDRYARAGLYLSLMSLNAAILALPEVYQNTLLAQGSSRAHAVITGVTSGLTIAATVIGFHLGGPVGMIVGAGIAALGFLAMSCWFAARRGVATPVIDIVNVAVILVAYAAVLARAG